jgi:hypothetical protein
MRDANRVSDEGGSHDQNKKEHGQSVRPANASQTISRKQSGEQNKVGKGSGNKSGGSGHKASDKESNH